MAVLPLLGAHVLLLCQQGHDATTLAVLLTHSLGERQELLRQAVTAGTRMRKRGRLPQGAPAADRWQPIDEWGWLLMSGYEKGDANQRDVMHAELIATFAEIFRIAGIKVGVEEENDWIFQGLIQIDDAPEAKDALRELGALYKRRGDNSRSITWYRRYLQEADLVTDADAVLTVRLVDYEQV